MVFHLINHRIFVNRKVTNATLRTFIIAPARERMPLKQKWLYILSLFIIPQLYPMYIIHNLPYYKGELPKIQEVPTEVVPEDPKVEEEPKKEEETKGTKGKKKAKKNV